jgi:hypothetical protein
MRYRRTTWAAALILLVSAAAFCAEIRTDYDHGADFAAIHTYSWGRVNASNPFYVRRIRRAVDRALQANGWRLAPSGGDATIFAADRIKNEQELETMYEGMGGWRGGGLGDATTSTIDQRVGALVIDIFQSSTKKLMWRGSVMADLSGNSSKNREQLEENIGKLFSKSPFNHRKS